MRRTVFFIFLVALLATFLNVKADDDETGKLFKEGLRHYELGQFDEAATKFEEFLSKEPSSELVLKLLENSHTRPLVDMHQNEKLRGIASRILRIPTAHTRQLKLNDERTEELVNVLLAAEYSKTQETRKNITDAQEKLVIIGAPSIPFMLPHLGKKNAETLRSTFQVTIAAMGEEAGLPLIQGLRHDNALIRANCALFLGIIGDDRAVPGLKALHENEKNKVVLENCEKALFTLTKKSVEDLPEARLLFMQQANEYIHKSPRVIRSFIDDLFLLFSFEKQKQSIRRTELTGKGYIWHLEMAEECCYRALSTPGKTQDKDIYPLMANVYYNQLDVLDSLIKQRISRGVSDDTHKKELDDLKAHRKELRKAMMFGPLFGTDTLHEILQIAIKERNSYVTESVNNAMRKTKANVQHTEFLKLPVKYKFPKLNAKIFSAIQLKLEKVASIQQKISQVGSLDQELKELAELKKDIQKLVNKHKALQGNTDKVDTEKSKPEDSKKEGSKSALPPLTPTQLKRLNELKTRLSEINIQEKLNNLPSIEAEAKELPALKEEILKLIKRASGNMNSEETKKSEDKTAYMQNKEVSQRLAALKSKIEDMKLEGKVNQLPTIEAELKELTALKGQIDVLIKQSKETQIAQ